MQSFWELFKESVILQGVLSVFLWGIAGYLMATGKDVPPLLAAGCGSIITFWFTAKVTRSIHKAVK